MRFHVVVVVRKMMRLQTGFKRLLLVVLLRSIIVSYLTQRAELCIRSYGNHAALVQLHRSGGRASDDANRAQKIPTETPKTKPKNAATKSESQNQVKVEKLHFTRKNVCDTRKCSAKHVRT